MPSATPAYVPAIITWLTALPSCPAPGGPRCVIRPENASSSGVARCDVGRIAAGEHGQRAPLGSLGAAGDGRVHHTDARSASRAASCAVTAGETVEQSTTIAPCGIVSAIAAGPNITCSRSGESDTQVNTASASRAAAAGDSAARGAQLGQRQLALAGAVVHRHLMAGVEQMPRHRRAHRPQPDHPDSHPRCYR